MDTEGCEEIVIEIVEDALEEGGKKTRPCNACGKPFKDLGRHLETHGYDNCLECLLHFPDKKSLDDHLMFTHQVAPEWHYCGVCDVSFSSVAILAIHNAKHTGRFECPLCEFVVKGRYRHSLINHIRRHEGKFEVRCEVCGQGFFSKTSLTSHLEMHAGIPKYECEYCKKRFTVKRYLEVHKSSNHKKELYGVDESFQCYICGRRFSFEKSLIRHLSAIHKVGEDRTVNCPVCNKTIANNHNLKKHMRTHTGEKRFCCDLCGKVFSEKKYLHKHQEIHEREKEHKLKRQELITKSESFEEEYLIEFDDGDYHLLKPQMYLVKTPNGLQIVLGAVQSKVIQVNTAQTVKLKQKPQPCPDCGRMVMFLSRHMQLKHHKIPIKTNAKVKPKQCPECGKFFLSLAKHLRLVHNKVSSANQEQCPKCGKNVRFLSKHLKLKHEHTKQTHLCPICGKLIGVNSRHRHPDKYNCDLCIATFKSQELLNAHKTIHTTEHHTCHECWSIFPTLTELALHQHKHTKKYQCPKCEKTFKTSSSLANHVSAEENKFKYRCEQCGKGFALKHLLEDHLDRHQSTCKYQCRYCDKKFAVRPYLRSHERLNHKKEISGQDVVYQCEICSRLFTFECSLKRHLRLVHQVGGADKKVQCKECGKMFTTTYSLTVHTRLHTGEKNYSCTVCGEAFSRAQYLSRHVNRRHQSTV